MPSAGSAAPGPLFTTFSIVARCARTGRLGVGIATRSIAVASRCSHARVAVGAVATQAYTDPRLGAAAIRLLELGFSAEKVLRELVDSDPHRDHRQLAVVDRDGRAAAHTGSLNHGWAGQRLAPGVAVIGNGLMGAEVADAMMDAFQEDGRGDLEERVLRGIEAGRDAGGQAGGQRSSGLLVYAHDPYPWVDLRVDDHAEPIGELRRIFTVYAPLREYFSVRPARPETGSEQEWLARSARGPAAGGAS
jgi:uncharacterized Ntn-hydrolase superfamily protein